MALRSSGARGEGGGELGGGADEWPHPPACPGQVHSVDEDSKVG